MKFSRFAWCVLFSAPHLFALNAGAQPADKGPSGRDLYVGCSLLLRGTDVPLDEAGRIVSYSGAMCAAASIAAISNREGAVPREQNSRRFCLPDTGSEAENPAVAMAKAYLDFYEATGAQLADSDGSASYVAAMIRTWPCTPDHTEEE